MMCPYRISTNKRITRPGSTETKIVEETVFEECYEHDCPFYTTCDDFIDPVCGRVINEIGGNCL